MTREHGPRISQVWRVHLPDRQMGGQATVGMSRKQVPNNHRRPQKQHHHPVKQPAIEPRPVPPIASVLSQPWCLPYVQLPPSLLGPLHHDPRLVVDLVAEEHLELVVGARVVSVAARNQEHRRRGRLFR